VTDVDDKLSELEHRLDDEYLEHIDFLPNIVFSDLRYLLQLVHDRKVYDVVKLKSQHASYKILSERQAEENRVLHAVLKRQEMFSQALQELVQDMNEEAEDLESENVMLTSHINKDVHTTS
jgi:hypothetical protein